MRTHYTTEVVPGKTARVAGWVHEVRDIGKLVFVVLRDSRGMIQIIGKKGETPDKVFGAMGKLGKEHIISVEGMVAKNERAKKVEIQAKKLDVLTAPEADMPIDVTGKTPAELDTRLDYRYLDFRNPKVAAIFKIRAEVCKAARAFFDANGFTELNCPKIIGSGSEGGADIFEVKYYDKKAFLIQSPQLHKQAGIAGFDRVYDIGPVWRAEKSHTTRHVAEFWGIDAEMAFVDQKQMMEIQEGLIVHIFKQVGKECKKELETLGKKLEVPKTPFKRMPYDEALKRVNKLGHKVKWGEDLPRPAEGALCASMDRPFFLIGFPWAAGTSFYYDTDSKNPKASKKVDLMLHGENGVEISSGGQRQHDINELRKRIKAAGITEKSLGWYLEMYRCGLPPHSGFGLGLERILRGMLQIEHVTELVPFPRTPERLVP